VLRETESEEKTSSVFFSEQRCGRDEEKKRKKLWYSYMHSFVSCERNTVVSFWACFIQIYISTILKTSGYSYVLV